VTLDDDGHQASVKVSCLGGQVSVSRVLVSGVMSRVSVSWVQVSLTSLRSRRHDINMTLCLINTISGCVRTFASFYTFYRKCIQHEFSGWYFQITSYNLICMLTLQVYLFTSTLSKFIN